MGYEDFVLKLSGPSGKQRVATSKLGLGYAKVPLSHIMEGPKTPIHTLTYIHIQGPGGVASLFAPSEGKTAEIVDLKVYVVAR